MAKTTATKLFIGNAKKSFTHFCSRFIRVLSLNFSNFLLLSTMQQHLEVCIKKRTSKKQK